MTLFRETLHLRPYQAEAIAGIDEAVEAGARAPLLVLPTGAGKTVIASEILRRHAESGRRALFLAPRRELIDQASEKLTRCGVEHGVILAGAEHLRASYARIQVASIDTLQSRLRRLGEVPDAWGISLVIIDEAHLAVTERRKALLDQWPDAVRIGLTATPTRKDGRALGRMFDRLIEPVTTADLTEQGYLAPARYFSLSQPDLERVKIVAGDYNQRDLEKAVNRPNLVGDIVATWLRQAASRRTIVFCVGIGHSAAMAEAFLRAGVSAEHIDGEMTIADREGILERFRSGRTQVLTNAFLASYGFDLPEVSCITLARPTKSLMLYLQMLGRGLRVADGKQDCLVLDHSGCVHRFGFATDRRPWTLDGAQSLAAGGRPERRESAQPKQIECSECRAVFSRTRACPECGYRLPAPTRPIETLDGDLVEIGAGMPEDAREKMAFYLELCGYAAQKRYKPGFATAKYRERYEDWPPREWKALPAAVPSLATRRWVLSRRIAWLKSRRADA